MSEARTLPLLRMEMLPVLRRLPQYSRLTWALVKDRRVRRRHKAILLGGIVYLLSPIDLIPGIIPVLGQLDDLAVALWALRLTLDAMPAEMSATHLAEHNLTREVLAEDLTRVTRSGRLIAVGAARFGGRLAAGAGRQIWRLGRQLLAR